MPEAAYPPSARPAARGALAPAVSPTEPLRCAPAPEARGEGPPCSGQPEEGAPAHAGEAGAQGAAVSSGGQGGGEQPEGGGEGVAGSTGPQTSSGTGTGVEES